MTNADLLQQWKQDEQAYFEGWDFSYLRGRMEEDELPWDYVALARELVRNSTSLLDMATGGGELFSQLGPFPAQTYAVEGWHPNVSVAEKRLAPLGVTVVEADPAQRLPFPDEQFDLVLNRHGGYNVPELSRILKAQGQFFSQQVGGDNLVDLTAFFDSTLQWPFNTLEHRIPEFEGNGFRIHSAQDWTGKVTFLDVGAIVYFLKTIPWIVAGFSVETHASYLQKLQDHLDRGQKLEFTYTRHLIHAIKG